ncbi:hypothetical protein [Solimonas soli]|uniref:hypothetical protein n=1 Tax=Solimonas soli TaxID=413479 RepID=UPI000488BAA5|nr:hypothetical protein [Solimonas soli]
MTAYHVFEVLIVVGVVGYALWNFASRFFPKLRGTSAAKSAGCADCSGGGCCDTPAAAKKTEHPLRFHR